MKMTLLNVLWTLTVTSEKSVSRGQTNTTKFANHHLMIPNIGEMYVSINKILDRLNLGDQHVMEILL